LFATGTSIAFLSLIDTSAGINGKHHTWRGLTALATVRSINPLFLSNKDELAMYCTLNLNPPKQIKSLKQSTTL